MDSREYPLDQIEMGRLRQLSCQCAYPILEQKHFAQLLKYFSRGVVTELKTRRETLWDTLQCQSLVVLPNLKDTTQVNGKINTQYSKLDTCVVEYKTQACLEVISSRLTRSCQKIPICSPSQINSRVARCSLNPTESGESSIRCCLKLWIQSCCSFDDHCPILLVHARYGDNSSL